jgi:hypothetical protein
LRFSLTTLYGSDFEGGHFSQRGTTADGSGVPVPLYRHEVSLDYARVELGLQYTLAPGWDVIGRVPWESKEQRAAIAPVDAATPEQRAAMQRNIDLHHRSVTLRGIGDLMLLGRRRWSNTWRDGDALTVSAGATLPIGRTVENPYRLGEQGIQHLHIQFGTGTIDPLLETSYHAPIAGRLSAGAYLAGRFPFYENKRSFRAPPDATLGIHVAHRTTDHLQIRLEGAVYGQGYGSWDGLRDENTGLLATSITGGATVRLTSFSLSADVRYPISQRTLTEGDAFTQGPTVVVTVGGLLSRYGRRR